MQDLVSKIENESWEYGGIPFWSWNDQLDPKELRRQIQVMKELGMKGFFMHARGGLETEYLSEEWFQAYDACVDEAKKEDMQAWAYDENGWPSGFGGGKLLENPHNYATYLRLEIKDEFPEIQAVNPPERNVLAVYIQLDGKYVKVDEVQNAEKYYVIYQNYDNSYVDTMDASITKEFIACTHEEYKKRNPIDFGKAMPGFFTDEPQYFRYATVWSNLLPQEFEKAYHYPVWDVLPALFLDYEGAEEHRYDYWALCHKLFIKNFVKVIYDWCEENGCQLTGHAVEEAFLFGQMWCCGGVMPFYEYEHIPGIDYLGRGISGDLAMKQVGSVAAQLGKKKVLSEMFGCCGWDVSPLELKKIADIQYASGVNVMCHHLYAYSIRGQRKRDYPANYSEHLPWQNALGDFVKYYNRLGYLLAQGKEKVNTLVIHPIHSAYLSYKREPDRASIEPLESGIAELLSFLSDNQIGYHFGDEELMAKYGSVNGHELVVGNCRYEYVVIPRSYTLDLSTASLLRQYMENGGKIYIWDQTPNRIDGRVADLSWLKTNVTFAEIKANAYASLVGENQSVLSGVKMMTRDIDEGRLYYITNVSGRDYTQAKITLKNAAFVTEMKLEEVDWKTQPMVTPDYQIVGNDLVLDCCLEDGMSKLYLVTDDIQLKPSEPDKIQTTNGPVGLDSTFQVKSVSDNALTLDYAQVSYDGVQFEEAKPIIEIFDRMLRNRYHGTLHLRYSFLVDEVPNTISMAIEPMRFKSVSVNGQPIELTDNWWLDRSFKTADIRKYIQVGQNQMDVSFDYWQRDYVYYVLYSGVSESLRNCLAFDTEIESMYLFGDFGIRTDLNAFADGPRNSEEYVGQFAIGKAPKNVCASDIVKEGFPFFAGKIELERTFNVNEARGELYLNGRYSYADVYVNSQFVKRLMFTHHCDISSYLKVGENQLKVVMCNSNRNLLGPHHFADPEPYALGPTAFSLEKMWDHGHCDAFRERYAFVRFGFDAQIKF